MAGIFIDKYDLMKLTGMGDKSCYWQLKTLRDRLGKKNKRAKITIKEYCDIEELDYNFIQSIIRL